MNIASTGKRFNGKTTLARYMASKAQFRVIFDPTPNRGSFPRRPHQSYATTPATARAAILETLGAIDASAPDYLVNEIPIDEVLIAPRTALDETFFETCLAVDEWMNRERDTLDPPGLAFLVDEVTEVSGRAMPEPFDTLARCGDFELFHLIVTTHNPQDVPARLRSIVNFWCLFQTTDSNALEVIRERCGDDVADEVRMLQAREYILFDDGRRTWDTRRDASRWAPRALEERAS